MDTVINVGMEAPNFELTDLHGKKYSLSASRGRIVVIYFWSAECTWCDRVDGELLKLCDGWGEGVDVLWVASNANEPRNIVKRVAQERNIPAVLLDEQQKVADLYGAQTTPHFFIIDVDGKLAYKGAWDDITFRQRVATQTYVPDVVDSLRNGTRPQITQTQPYGCVLVRYTE